MKKSLSNYDHFLVFIFFLSLGFGPLLHFFNPVKVLSVSLFVVFIPFLLLFFLFCKNLTKLRNKLFFLIISSMFFLILLLRNIFYDEGIIPLIIENIFALYIPMLWMLFKNFDFTSKRSNTFLLLIKLFLIIYSLNSLFYVFGLPNINLISDDTIIGSRFNGLLGGSNVTGNFISLLLVLLISTNNKLSVFQVILFGSLAFFGVLPTLSKGSYFIVLIATFYAIVRQLNKKTLKKSFLIMIFVIFLLNTSISRVFVFLISFNDRLSSQAFSSGRLERIEFAFNLFSQDLQNILIGIPIKYQTSFNDTSLSISDNSLLLISANFGIPFLIFSLLFILNQFRDIGKISMNLKFYIVIIIFVLLINNAVLYFQFCVFAIAGYYFIKSRNLNIN